MTCPCALADNGCPKTCQLQNILCTCTGCYDSLIFVGSQLCCCCAVLGPTEYEEHCSSSHASAQLPDLARETASARHAPISCNIGEPGASPMDVHLRLRSAFPSNPFLTYVAFGTFCPTYGFNCAPQLLKSVALMAMLVCT